VNWRYEHFRNINGGCITLAMRDLGDETSTFSYALCSPRQRFSKQVGRDIARGRGAHERLSAMVSSNKGSRAAFRAALIRLINGVTMKESWVVRAQWLRDYIEDAQKNYVTPEKIADVIILEHLRAMSNGKGAK